jgi:ParB family transcriptional regulator, chromosome partitioning protein
MHAHAAAELPASTTMSRLQALHNTLDALQAEQAARQHLFHVRRGEGVAQADAPPVPNNKVDQPMQRALSIDLIRPGEGLRHDFADAELDELAESIRQQGILQPLLVRPFPGSPTAFQIIAGARRWRAAQRAQLHEVPVIVREVGDTEALEMALVENLQREDLSPLEEARAYKRLLASRGCTISEIAQVLGRSQSHISNMTRLLALPDPVLARLEDGELTVGHARALLAAADPVALAAEVVRRGLSTRQVEHRAQRGAAPRKNRRLRDADADALERRLCECLGLHVALHSGMRGGSLVLKFRSKEQLDHLVDLLLPGDARVAAAA